MSDRRRPPVKRADDILENVFVGHREALTGGPESGKRYLLNFLEKFNSIPNEVKFYIYDLLAEDAYQADDLVLCRQAVGRAGEYLEEARARNSRQLAEYLPALRFVERGISLTVEAGEYEAALSFCDLALENGLGKAYAAKRASIEKML
ncbi:MAG: hypothetical protein HQL20_03255 [Candidatus Omnitrophica bacterium]|nr:hypothetical protein [Candidatus Omnitrophota bacterium]